jgi:hypothetical protein
LCVSLIKRSTFYNHIKGRENKDDWHVLLSPPTIAAPVNMENIGDGFGLLPRGFAAPIGLFPIEYIDGAINAYLATHPLPEDVVPIFATYNSGFYLNGNASECCVGGYHGPISARARGSRTVIKTMMMASWFEPEFYQDERMADISVLSHEVRCGGDSTGRERRE